MAALHHNENGNRDELMDDKGNTLFSLKRTKGKNQDLTAISKKEEATFGEFKKPLPLVV